MDEMWAELAERVKRREEVEERLKQVDEKSHRREAEKAGRELREALDSEKKWAEFTEKLREQDELDARLRRVGENFLRHEEERAQAEEKKRAEFVERVKKREQLEDEMRRFGEEFQRKEQTRARGPEGSAAEVGRPAAAKSNTTEVGGREAGPVKEDEARLHGGAERSLGIEQRTPPESRPKERVFPERPTVEELDRAIQQHPHLEKIGSGERYREAVEYCQSEHPDSRDETRTFPKRPSLIDTVEQQEQARAMHELDVSPEAQLHRVSPEVVREVLRKSETGERLSISEQANIVHELYKANANPEKAPVHYAELYQACESLGKDRFREVAQGIHENRTELERLLNKHLGLDGTEKQVRIAVTDDRLYYWTMYNGPDDWLNVLRKEKFYFENREAKLDLIDQTTRHLHVRGGPEAAQFYLSDIMNQLSHLDSPRLGRVQRYGTPPNLDGETLHFFSDVLGMTLEDLKPRLSHLGMKEGGRIYDLKFPDIHEYRAKFAAIIDSDGYHSLDDRVSYYKKDPERKRIAVDVLREFGDFRVRPDANDPKRVSLPKVMSALAEGFGIPRGDKGIHNHGLHEGIIRAKPEVKVAYLREVVPEDGCVSGTVVSIVRHNVLHGGVKSERYRRLFGIEPYVTQEHIQLVCDEGRKPKKGLTYEKGDVVELPMRWLDEFTESKDKRIRRVAVQLSRIIDANPNALLKDEQNHLLSHFGVLTTIDVGGLSYYKKTGRLSVKSTLRTNTVENAMRWMLIAPPNDPTKMEVAVKLLSKRLYTVREIKSQIARDGLTVSPAWEAYGL